MPKVIAIDGAASSGKYTISKFLSKKYNSPLLHSGLLYRKISVLAIQNGINIKSKKELLKCVHKIEKTNYKNDELYSNKVSLLSSKIATKKYVRDSLIHLQREFPKKYGKRKRFVIIEGRDIGTVVFPNADYKFFFWASANIRAKRRYEQLIKNGEKVGFKGIYKDIIHRDKSDLNRKVAPLKPAVNSLLIDTSFLSISAVLKIIERNILIR